MNGAPLAETRPDNVQFPLLRRAILDRGFHAERRFGTDEAEFRLSGPALAEAIPA